MNHGVHVAFFLLLSSFVASLSGCKKDDQTTAPPSTTDQMIPLNVGNRWIFSKNATWSTGIETVSVSHSFDAGGITAYGFTGDDDFYFNYDQVNEGMFYRNGSLWGRKAGTDGVFLKQSIVSPDSYAVNCWNTARIKILSTSEMVAVPAGTFDCVKFNLYSDYYWTYWVSKNVGVVKVHYRTVQGADAGDAILQSYSLR